MAATLPDAGKIFSNSSNLLFKRFKGSQLLIVINKNNSTQEGTSKIVRQFVYFYFPCHVGVCFWLDLEDRENF
jgi:hypothetical protein